MDPDTLDVKLSVCPAQIAELFAATGAAGIGLTVIFTLPVGPWHPPIVAATE